jgi:hypothetical protein
MDGWTLPGPPAPAGDGGQSADTGWVRAQTAPFIETPIVTTTDTVYTGFAFEAVTGAANRNALMAAVLTHLGAPKKPVVDAPAPTPVQGQGPPEGAPPTTTPPTTTPPVVTPGQRRLLRIIVARLRRLSLLRTRGVPVTVQCETGCRVRLDLIVSRATQRRYRLRSRLIGRRTVTMGATGRRSFVVRLSSVPRSRLRSARTITVSVRAVQTDIRPAVRKSGSVRVTRSGR